MSWFETILLLIGSTLSNALAAMSGGGAGLLQFPLLLFLGLPFAQALATHKLASVALGFGAAYSHLKTGTLSFKFGLFVTLFGLVGVMLGAHIILQVPDAIARSILGWTILLLGCYSFFKKDLGQCEVEKADTWGRWVFAAFTLFVIGAINGSITAGSGLLVTVFLVRCFGFSYKKAVAYTLVCVGIFWNGTGGIAVAYGGAPIHWIWLPTLLIGSFLGGAMGAWLSQRFSNRVTKTLFEVLTFAVGIKLLI